MLRLPPKQKLQQVNKASSQMRWVIWTIVALLIIGGTVSAILTEGSWGQTVSLILAALGVVLALYQILIQPSGTSFVTASSKSGLTNPSKTLVKFFRSILAPHTTRKKYYDAFRKRYESRLTETSGTLIIYASEKEIGLQLVVNVHQRTTNLPPLASDKCVSGFIALHTIDGQPIFAVVFERLLPNSCHVWHRWGLPIRYQHRPITVINVAPGEVTEYYWGIRKPS
jgi:hypothetical protein